MVWFHYLRRTLFVFLWGKFITCKQTFQKYKDSNEHLKKLEDEVNLLKSFSRAVHNFPKRELVIFNLRKLKKIEES